MTTSDTGQQRVVTNYKDRAAVLWASRVVLAAVALAGAVLSFRSLYAYAVPAFGKVLAVGFPLLVDALVAGASLAYIASCQAGRPRRGWRLIAHGGVLGTVILNGLASPDLAGVPLHVTAPIVWSVLVEMVARDSTFSGTPPLELARIPWVLWVTAPIESVGTVLRLARQAGHARARLEVGLDAAAREALRLALPGWRARRVRRILGRQLRSGSLTPAAALALPGQLMGRLPAGSPRGVLRDVLVGMASSTSPPHLEPPGLNQRDSAASALAEDPADLAERAEPARTRDRPRPVQSGPRPDPAPGSDPDLADLGDRSGRNAIRYAAVAADLSSGPEVRSRLAAVGVEVSEREARRVMAQLTPADAPAGPAVRLSLAKSGASTGS